MYSVKEIRDNIEMTMETIKALVSATGTKEQKELLDSLEVLVGEAPDFSGEAYILVAQGIMDILSNPLFNLDFVSAELQQLKFSISSLSTLKLKEQLDSTKEILKENNVVEDEVIVDVADLKETEVEVVEVVAEEANQVKEEIKEEKMKTKNEKVNEEVKETETEKTIRELKEKLAKAKEKVKGCKTSTLAKVGKTTLGVGLLVGAAAAGYYVAKKYGTGNTTIILNGNDEE